MSELIFEKNDVKTVGNKLKEKLAEHAPVVSVSYSDLGGEATLFIFVSMDPKNTWAHNIAENSRYFQIAVEQDGTIRQFVKCYKIQTKFRKCTVKSFDDAIAKIIQYIDSLKREEHANLMGKKLSHKLKRVAGLIQKKTTPLTASQFAKVQKLMEQVKNV